MNTDLEMRISARNNTSRAFGEVRTELQRTGAAISPLERNVERLGSVAGMLPGIFAASFAGIGVEQFARAVMEASRSVAEIGRQAKITGLSAEAFQTLGYAAEKNQIAVDNLGQGIREMQDKASEFASEGGGRAADALKMIGFTSTSAAQALRDPEEMFKTIIERVRELHDRAQQIRILGDIFGNADGDKFLRFLDQGRQGIEGWQGALRASGQVMTEEMIKKADVLDKKFKDIQRRWDFWLKSFVVNAVSALGDLDASGIPRTADGRLDFSRIGPTDEVGNGPDSAGFDSMFGGRGGSGLPDTSDFDVGTTFNILSNTGASRSFDSVDAMWKRLTPPKEAQEGLKELSQEAATFARMMGDIAPLLDASHDPFTQLQSDLDTLGALLNKGKISWEEYARAVQNAQWNAVASVAGAAGEITGALTQIFEGNKQFAAANAVVNGIEAVSKAMTAYPFPWNLGAAAAQAALSAVQVSNILSATPSSTSMPSSGVAGGSAPAIASGPNQGTTIVLRGSDTSVVGIGGLEGFMRQLAENLSDGGGTQLINVIRERTN